MQILIKLDMTFFQCAKDMMDKQYEMQSQLAWKMMEMKRQSVRSIRSMEDICS